MKYLYKKAKISQAIKVERKNNFLRLMMNYEFCENYKKK